ncbi:MAG: recombinase family protein [Planctomycetaceae bacterium]|jgi:DNA invertase Pin-like site-specific DNA recombinase|nr:recombinase family protein [Planctomycetaceae bacterium]
MATQIIQSGVAAVYARYSSDLQDISSIDGQIRKSRDWAVRNKLSILENNCFSDEAVSGTKDRRPGLDQMLAAAEKGEFDVLIVESLSRLARSHIFASTVMMHLVYVLKIRIVGIDDGCDTNNSNWELLAGIKNILNEQFIRDLGNMVRRGHVENLMQGFSIGDLCFGYKSEPAINNRSHGGRNPKPKMQYSIHDSQAIWVKEIFNWYVYDGKSLRWIARELNKNGVPKDHRATTNIWHHNSVKIILSNKKYIGIWSWGKKRNERNPINGKIRCIESTQDEIEKYTRKLNNLRLVEDSTFEKAQQLLKQTNIKYKETKQNFLTQQKNFIYSIVRCGTCGSAYVNAGSNGQYLQCKNYKNGGNCDNKTFLKRKTFEHSIMTELSDQFLSDKKTIKTVYKITIDFLRTYSEEVRSKLNLKEREMELLERKINMLIETVGKENADQNKFELDKKNLSRDFKEQMDVNEFRLMKEDINKLQTKRCCSIKLPKPMMIQKKLDELIKNLSKRVDAAYLILHDLLKDRVTVVPIKVPGRVRYDLRCTIRITAYDMVKLLTGIEPSIDKSVLIKEIIFDCKNKSTNKDISQKAINLFKKGTPIKTISKTINMSITQTSRIIKKDYEQKNLPKPDFRKQKKQN